MSPECWECIRANQSLGSTRNRIVFSHSGDLWLCAGYLRGFSSIIRTELDWDKNECDDEYSYFKQSKDTLFFTQIQIILAPGKIILPFSAPVHITGTTTTRQNKKRTTTRNLSWMRTIRMTTSKTTKKTTSNTAWFKKQPDTSRRKQVLNHSSMTSDQSSMTICSIINDHFVQRSLKTNPDRQYHWQLKKTPLSIRQLSLCNCSTTVTCHYVHNTDLALQLTR